jgi:hypothetical protein
VERSCGPMNKNRIEGGGIGEHGVTMTPQPLEPPGADPHAGWCGRGGAARLPPIPIPLRSLRRDGSPNDADLPACQMESDGNKC